jgi:putative methyltransferase (TIGR04325 family)
MNARTLLKQSIPPIFVPFLRNIYNWTQEKLTGTSNEMKYVKDGWSYLEKHPEVRGYNVADWIETCKKSLLAYKEISGRTDPLVPFGQDLTSDDAMIDHNRMMLLGYSMMLASRGSDCVSILDWGGALGHLYYIARAMLPEGTRIDFHCKDVPLVAEYGSRYVGDISFCADESCLARSYDLVMAHASLYYSEDWQEVFSGLAKSSHGYLLLTRIPFVTGVPSYVCLERLYRFHYNVEALCWVLNRMDFLNEAKRLGLELVREFITGQAYKIPGAPEQPVFRGFLFRTDNPQKSQQKRPKLS